MVWKMKSIEGWQRGRRIKVVGLLLAIAIGITQTGCNRQSLSSFEADSSIGAGEEAESQQGNNQEASEEESEITLKDIPDMPVEVEPVRKVRTGNLELTHADFKLTIRDWDVGKYTEVSIGSLVLKIPFGWKIEQRVSEEGVKQYILMDIHSECANEEIEEHRGGYEHEIIITPYEINQMPELTLQLAAEMKVFFHVPILCGVKGAGKTEEIEGCWMYGENRDAMEMEYFIFLENDAGEKELFQVREGNSYVTAYQNDVENFRDFLDKNLVKEEGGKDVVNLNRLSEMEFYFLLNEKTDDSLLAVIRQITDEIAVYRTGDYQNALSMQIVDTKRYPAYFQIADLNQDGYEDILCNYWQLDAVNSYDGEIEGYLWEQESGSFTYAVDRQLFGMSPAAWESREKESRLQGDKQIPQDLLDYLSEPLLNNKDEMGDIMLPLVSGRKLDIEEVKELSKENRDIKNEFLVIASNMLYAEEWFKVDADNDGIEDIFLREYPGGSLGNVFFCLFKGTEEGKYSLTSREEGLKMEFAFINWEEKNYLARTTCEFTNKCVDGISLGYYEDGKYQGGIKLHITAKEGVNARSISTSYLEKEEYSSLASSIETFAGKYQSGERVPCGTAEENKDGNYRRSSDINNDGEMEEYNVSLWQTDNYYTVDHLNFEAKEEEINNQVYDLMREDDVSGIFMNLWVDETDYGNIIYALYEDGLYDFHICGYLLTEAESRKLLQVDCYVQTEITYHSINTHENWLNL
ncbi:MAG: hypothetical protein HDQ97_07090 [Lachnospiraceae bacterium]|nr:hypothetical protein [Lachnospiraceae bacterium]